jgi:thiamine-monophosphate kinase
MTLEDLGELGVIRSLLPYLAPAGGELLIGPGQDDAAAWREPDGSITVASCDASIERVHFDFGRLTPREVGWRALALALGDLAAKGAKPTYGLVSVSVPAGFDHVRLLEIYEGMAQVAARTGLKLAGGDTTSSPGPACLGITVLGRATGDVIARSAARPGWTVAVTGRLGAAAAGLRAALAGQPLEPDWEQALKRPLPRLAEGQHLSRWAICCGDISDGLLREMEKFAAAAGTGCELSADAVPLATGVSVEEALASGEEVELVCVGPEASLHSAAAEVGCELTFVGVLTPDAKVVVVDREGKPLELEDHGYDHFA